MTIEEVIADTFTAVNKALNLIVDKLESYGSRLDQLEADVRALKGEADE